MSTPDSPKEQTVLTREHELAKDGEQRLARNRNEIDAAKQALCVLP